MATVIVLNANEADPFVRLRGALDDPRPILERIGAIMEAGSQQAFDDQRLGEWIWPERYPGQSEPFINVAGAVSDFASGREEPKARRFDRRPALRDTSNLLGSIRSRVVSDDTVEVGSTVEYAAAHQWGGITTQTLDNAARKRMAKWLSTSKGRPYVKKLGRLIGLVVVRGGKLDPQGGPTELETEVAQRPFLGVTKQMEDDISETVELMLAEAAGGSV